MIQGGVCGLVFGEECSDLGDVFQLFAGQICVLGQFCQVEFNFVGLVSVFLMHIYFDGDLDEEVMIQFFDVDDVEVSSIVFEGICIDGGS